jgi:DNA-binding transcriptional regulator YiaG
MTIPLEPPPPRTLHPVEVRAIRRALGWTQRQLADTLGVAVMTVARWEQGARGVTPLAATSLMLLAQQHGVTPTPRVARRRKAS